MPPRAERPLSVVYEGRTDGLTHGSWALVNRRLLPRLEAVAGLRVLPVLPGGTPEGEGAPHDVWLSHYYPGLEPHRVFAPPTTGTRRWVCWVAWEAGPAPMHWEDAWRAGRVDEVWACSAHARRLLLASTRLDPARVRVMPYGVDTALFRPDGPLLPKDAEAFRVLYVGGAVPRKGFDLAVDAYDRAFQGDEGTRLVLKLQGLRSFYREAPPMARPRRILDTQIIDSDAYTDEQMAMLYRSVDIVCQPYRAEGFCLPLLEAWPRRACRWCTPPTGRPRSTSTRAPASPSPSAGASRTRRTWRRPCAGCGATPTSGRRWAGWGAGRPWAGTGRCWPGGWPRPCSWWPTRSAPGTPSRPRRRRPSGSPGGMSPPPASR